MEKIYANHVYQDLVSRIHKELLGDGYVPSDSGSGDWEEHCLRLAHAKKKKNLRPHPKKKKK
jgi:hypothetical protein